MSGGTGAVSTSRQIAVLSACQALLVTNNIFIVSIGSLAGYLLAPDKAMATLPATTYIAGAASSSYLLSQLMRARGRRTGFLLGAAAALVGVTLCTVAVARHAFWLFCLGTAIAGVYTASGAFYRFAAADVAEPAFRSRAISLVLAGGMIGGILGPETSKLTRDALPIPFLGSYAVLIVLALVAMALIGALRLPALSATERATATRPLRAIARQPVFLVACLGAITSYAVMNLLMGATPLAMQMCGHPFSAATFVIETHIIGMYAPALFAGSLVHRFGATRVMAAGILAFGLCVAAGISGQTVVHFWLSSALLGIGWCFLFVGSTTLLAETHAPGEKAKAQGLNDMSVFISMGLSSAVSGFILNHGGWSALNVTAVPLLLLTALALAWLAWHRRAALPVTAADQR